MSEPSESNVVEFPYSFDITNPPTLAIARAQMVEIKTEFCQETTEFAYEQLIGILQSFGYCIDDAKTNAKDLKLIEESIFSMLCRYTNLNHPLQEMADAMMDDEEDDESEDVEPTNKVPAKG